MPLCAAKGMSIILGGPYNSGILATEPKEGSTHDYAPAPPEILAKAKRLSEVCRRHGVPLAAAALQFPLAHPQICSVIPGALSVAEVQQNIAHVRRDIPIALWQEMRAEGLLHPAAPVPQGGNA
jgi:D-threo-aldose 1-dehydrogenase